MEAINTIRKGNYELEILQDENPESPREWGNMGTMICFHRRYNLGDKHNFSVEEAEKMVKGEDICVSLPLYLYDHGGITMSTGSFSCKWDSGQVGWIFVTKEQVRKEYNVKRITKDIVKKVTRVLEGEVETYDQYLTGDVYGYRVSKIDVCDKGCEHKEQVDSCWGYYGEENAQEEGERTLEYYLNKCA
jgi:hypothetical protein